MPGNCLVILKHSCIPFQFGRLVVCLCWSVLPRAVRLPACSSQPIPTFSLWAPPWNISLLCLSVLLPSTALPTPALPTLGSSSEHQSASLPLPSQKGNWDFLPHPGRALPRSSCWVWNSSDLLMGRLQKAKLLHLCSCTLLLHSKPEFKEYLHFIFTC